MRWFLALLICMLPLASTAQEDDRGWLTGLLEDNLSGAGREVRIDGFEGALSSRATFDQMTIADSEGVWLTLTDGAISWNRSALISGRIEINEMTAAAIDIPRAPVAEDGLPSAEAQGFSLPELPVSVLVDTISAGRLSLGEPLFGAAAEVSLAGSMQLADGEGEASLSITRIDGPEGELTMTGAFANETRMLTLDLLVSEGADGIAANLIGLPGKPAITLAASGTGPIDDFRADIALSSERQPRLRGFVQLQSQAETPDDTPRRSFRAELGGDIAPLFLPDYQTFFGPSVQLVVEGARAPNGELQLSQLDLQTRALSISGGLVVSSQGVPQRANLDVVLGLSDGSSTLLPLTGPPTQVQSAKLKLAYDAAQDDGWSLDGNLQQLERPGVQMLGLRLKGSGRVGQGRGPRIGGTLEFTAVGLDFDDIDLAQAIGPVISGRATFYQQGDDALTVPSFNVTGGSYSATGRVSLAGPDQNLAINFGSTLSHNDLSSLSGLAGRSLGGLAKAQISGLFEPLTGVFDVEAQIEGTDIVVDQAELDRLLQGTARIETSIRRDLDGTDLRYLRIAARTLTADAAGRLSSDSSEVMAKLNFADLSVLGSQWRGSLDADAALTDVDARREIGLSATGRNLAVGQTEIDRLLSGRSTLSINLSELGERITLDEFQLANPQITMSATGSVDGDNQRLELDARLANMALIAPGFPGPLTLTGQIVDAPQGYGVRLSGQGPGSTTARVVGRVDQGFETVNLEIEGGAEAALANAFIEPRSVQGPVRFDLFLRGRPVLASLSGDISMSNARIVAPVLGYALENTQARMDLNGGRGAFSIAGNVRGGGRLTAEGPINLTPPFAADLSASLTSVLLRDPSLFETRVTGRLAMNGPLAGGARITGALILDETEIQVQPTGLGGTGDMPDITHIAEPADVRATRARAGVIADGEGRPTSRSRPYPLDVRIDAPNQIFVRGRGLEAELGGSLQLRGTTDDIQPAGQFDLVRGRLDILGKRFTLDEGQISLQGDFTPFIRFAASTQAEGITVTIVIEGLASEPQISFLSSPELPEEEVLSLLLFGRGLTNLSPLQAAQLASAIATLAGRGGQGIVERLREGFGLDDFDITTDEEGDAAVRAGKYLSDNLYTDVVVGAEGKSEINLNLDVSPSVTLRGSLGSDGQTGVGVYFERDY